MDKKKGLKFCELCRQSVQNEIKYGKFMRKGKISVHYYCLLLSSNLVQNGEENEGFLGFLPDDIIREAERVKTQYCYYCRENYANVTCCAHKCRKAFHLSCGVENGVISHFTGTYQSFCTKHAKWNKTERPSADEICLVCYEKLGSFNKYFMFLSPCCKTGWFHRWCLAKFALSAGYFFKCPKCNNSDIFREQVMRRGIFIPDQDAAWELEANAFAELLERPSECTANECNCPNGRSFDEGRYNLLICHNCGSKAIHSKCMEDNSKTFSCKDCTEILKNCTRNIDGQTSKDIDEIKEQISENESENVDICNNSDDNESTISYKVEEELENAESGDDDDSVTLKFIRVKNSSNPLRIDSDGEEVNDSSALSDDSLISKSHNLCNKNDEIDNNMNENLDDKEQMMIKEDNEISDNNLKMVNYRSSSVSSSESINRTLTLRRKKRKRTKKLSESSNISTSSSAFDFSLRRRVFKLIPSCESLYRSDNEECGISKISTIKSNNSTKDNNMMYESIHQTTMENRSTANNNCDGEIRAAAAEAQIDSNRCSSLGYVSDNFPSSSENLKLSAAANCYEYDNNYGKENKNMKRRRSNVDEYNYDENNSVSQRTTANNSNNYHDNNNSISESIKNKLRKRADIKSLPYQLRQRSRSISYVITDDYPELSNLNEKWSLIFSASQRATQPRRKKPKKFTESISKTGNLSARQTSIDSYLKRCQNASTSF